MKMKCLRALLKEMFSRPLDIWLEVQERGQDRRYIFECHQPRYETLGVIKKV